MTARTPPGRRQHPEPIHHGDREAGREQHREPALDRESVVEREEDADGGTRIGSAFSGGLTATGTAVLRAATGTATGPAGSSSIDQAVSGAQDSAHQDAGTIGLAGVIAVLVVLLVASSCGGHVAGRTVRSHGAEQGVTVGSG